MEIKFRVKGFIRKSYSELSTLNVVNNHILETSEHIIKISFDDDVLFKDVEYKRCSIRQVYENSGFRSVVVEII